MGRRAKGEGSITQHAKGHWQAELLLGHDQNGKRERRYITGRTQKEVREKLDALKREVHAGVYSDTKTTLKQYLDEWLETKRGQVEPKTLEGYRRTVKHISRHLGGVPLSKLSSQQVQRALGAIREESAAVVEQRCAAVNKPIPKGAGVRTANQCRTNLHTALEDAVTAVPPLLMRNPVAATKTLKAVAEEIVIWEPEQMAVFLEAARQSELYALFVLAVGSGLRRGELLGLRWQDVGASSVSVVQTVKLEDNKIVIGAPKTKSSRRRVPVSTAVIDALRAHGTRQDTLKSKLGPAYADQGLVFATALGKPLHPRNVERAFYALQDKARERLPGLPHGGLHILRHFYASSSIHSKVDAKTLSKRMGHTTVRLTLDRYTHIWEEVEAASEGLDISGLLTPRTPQEYVN